MKAAVINEKINHKSDRYKCSEEVRKISVSKTTHMYLYVLSTLFILNI